ncbi:hypothetical protein F5146DRAFT_1147316 [Armillaria mellea]|nr:hypothetical protein F5146DRAFT_1147316 [Armillaria mellea]
MSSNYSSSLPHASSPSASEEDDKLAHALREISILKDTIEKKCKRVLTNIECDCCIITEGKEDNDEDDKATLTEQEKEQREEIKRDQDHTYVGFNILIQVVDGLKAKLSDLTVMTLMNLASFNIMQIKDMLQIQIASSLNFPPTSLRNDFMGHLLSSILYDWEDESVWVTLCSGNLQRIEKGFLWSGLLLKVWCAIFMSPSSAEDTDDTENNMLDCSDLPVKHRKGNKKGMRGSVAMLCHLEGQVTLQMIAYAAVILHFNLTDATTWQEDYCSGPSDPASKQQVNDLLDWWTKKVFPHSVKGPEAKGATANSRKLLAAQCAAH